MTSQAAPGGPIERLRAATCSNGAPSARNLLVTVFGDALLPHGAARAWSIRSLTALVASFGINERLVRTSLSRLVGDGLLEVVPVGRRSFYRVPPTALELFAAADVRIYGGATPAWDGSWTLVVIDGAEATPARRARLRQELAWAGLGVVAPNVMASPLVEPDAAAAVVARVGGFTDVLVSRSRIVDGPGTLAAEELARRCAPLDEAADGYREFVARFAPLVTTDRDESGGIDGLDAEESFKLRILLVASFRRLVLAGPMLPDALLPADWIGNLARDVATRVYRRCATRAEGFVVECAESDLGAIAPSPDAAARFDGGPGIVADVRSDAAARPVARPTTPARSGRG